MDRLYDRPVKETKPRRGRPPGRKNNKTLAKEAEVRAKQGQVNKSKTKKSKTRKAFIDFEDGMTLKEFFERNKNHGESILGFDLYSVSLDGKQVGTNYTGVEPYADYIVDSYEMDDFMGVLDINIRKSKTRKGSVKYAIYDKDNNIAPDVEPFDTRSDAIEFLDSCEEYPAEDGWHVDAYIEVGDMDKTMKSDDSKIRHGLSILQESVTPQLSWMMEGGDGDSIDSSALIPFYDRIVEAISEIEAGLGEVGKSKSDKMKAGKSKKSIRIKGHDGTFRAIAKAGHYTMWESVEHGSDAYNVITQTKKNSKTGKLVERIVAEDVDGFNDPRVEKLGAFIGPMVDIAETVVDGVTDVLKEEGADDDISEFMNKVCKFVDICKEIGKISDDYNIRLYSDMIASILSDMIIDLRASHIDFTLTKSYDDDYDNLVSLIQQADATEKEIEALYNKMACNDYEAKRTLREKWASMMKLYRDILDVLKK